MKKTHLIILWLIILAGVFLLSWRYFSIRPKVEEIVIKGQCEIKEMIFYYTDWCPWCRKVKEEGTISELRQLGVDITEINIDQRRPRHQIRGVPAFVIRDNVYEGYKTLEQLKDLLNCFVFDDG